MFKILVKVIFKVVGWIGDIIMAPFVLFASAFIPNLDTYFSYIITFFSQAITYVNFVLNALMIPSELVSAVFVLLSTYITFKLGVVTYKLILNIYNKFKP